MGVKIFLTSRSSLVIWSVFFIVTSIFFLKIHPVAPLDGDDWGNLSMLRGAYPKWGVWNPSKVFPEIFFPIVGYISSFIVRPFGFDYLTSLSLTSGITISLFAATFFLNITLLLEKIFKLNYKKSLLISVMLYITMFGVFEAHENNENIHLFWAVNLTCYFHYFIPAILNATMVVYLSYKKWSLNDIKNMPSVSLGFLLLIVYLCIFSNVFSSIILLTYCFSKSLVGFFKDKKISKDNIFYYGVIFLWICAAIFEANGGRAASIGNHSFLLVDSVVAFYHVVLGIGKLFFILTILLFFAFAVMKIIYNKRSNVDSELLLTIFISFVFCTIGLLLIAAKSSPSYVLRPEAMWGVYFYMLFLVVLILGEFVKLASRVEIFLPFVLLLMFTRVILSVGTFREPFMLNISCGDVIKIDNFIIRQVQYADENDLKNITVYVPKGDDIDNWPFPTYMGPALSSTLRKHGVIKNMININISPDVSIRKKLDIIN